MSFKAFLISRVKLFFLLLPLTLTAFVILTIFFAPELKLTYHILISPLQLSIAGVLLSFVMYFRKKPTFRQYLLRLFLQLVLIQALFIWWLSLAQDAVIPAVPYHLIINGIIFVIYTFGVLMIWFQRNRQSRQMTEQLRKLQRQQAKKEASEKSLSGIAMLMAAALLMGCAAGQTAASDKPAVVSETVPVRTYDTVKYSAVFDGSYRSVLTEAQQVVYDALVQHYVVERKSNEDRLYFDAAAFCVGQPGANTRSILFMATKAFREDYPEIFWVTYETFDVQYDENNEMKTVSPRFTEFEGKYSEMETVMHGIDEAEAAIRENRKSESRYDTVKAIHDYLCRTVDYDLKTYNGTEFVDVVQEAFTVVPAFGGGPRPYKVVCEGYSKAFKALCNRFDVPCVYTGCADIAHGWNLVQMEDGAWYSVDVTWDDTETGSPIYEYFLVGSNAMARKHTHEISYEFPWLYDDDTEQRAYGPMISEESYKPAK